MPRVVAMIAALATFIDPGVGCSARNPPGQGKAHHENDNPLHVWICAHLMSHRNRPSPDKFRVAPPSSLCNSKVLSLRWAWHSSGADGCREDCSRPLETRLPIGRPAGPNIRPARPVGGASLRAKGPTCRLTQLRIANAILLAKGLPDISARWRGMGRC